MLLLLGMAELLATQASVVQCREPQHSPNPEPFSVRRQLLFRFTPEAYGSSRFDVRDIENCPLRN